MADRDLEFNAISRRARTILDGIPKEDAEPFLKLADAILGLAKDALSAEQLIVLLGTVAGATATADLHPDDEEIYDRVYLVYGAAFLACTRALEIHARDLSGGGDDCD